MTNEQYRMEAPYRRAAARERIEARRLAETHVHDFGMTISAGDVPADRFADLVARLYEASQKMVEEFNATSDIHVDAYVSYDGRRECDLQHPIPQPR